MNNIPIIYGKQDKVIGETENALPLLASDYKGITGRNQNNNAVAVKVIENVNPSGNNQGIFVQVDDELIVYAIWYEKYQCYVAIRKLTPKECFRLQGWTDDYFERAAFVNSDSQLYKQAGNGVTVPVIEIIGRKIKVE